MTGQLDTGLEGKKFWPKWAAALAEGNPFGGDPGTPVPDPPPPPALSAPGVFATHAAADQWLTTYQQVTGFDRPDDWDDMTVAEKRSAAQALYEHWIEDH